MLPDVLHVDRLIFKYSKETHVEMLYLTYDGAIRLSEVEAVNVPNSSAITYLQQSSMVTIGNTST